MAAVVDPKAWLNQGTGGSLIAYAGGVAGRAFIRGGGLELPGTSGNYASAPDSSALDITGDIDIKAKISVANWTPGAGNAFFICAKRASSNNSYALYITIVGGIGLVWSENGSTLLENVCNALGFANNSTKWVRATMDVDNGSSQRVVKFYTSDDGISWTLFQTGTAAATSIFSGNASLSLGTNGAAGGERMTGKLHRLIIQSAYDTADNTSNLAFDADFAAQVDYTRSFTESSSNAAVVTVNQSSTTNDPQLLQPETSGYLYLPGVSGNYMAVPHSAALSITGDAEWVFSVAMNDWTPSTVTDIAVRGNVNPNRTWQIRLNTDGKITLYWYPAGTDASLLTATSTVAVPFTNGQRGWVKITLDVDNGASGRDIKFFTSTDGTTYTQLGTTVTQVGVTSLPSVTSNMGVFWGDYAGASPFNGNGYSFTFLNGIGGTTVFDANLNVVTSHGQTTFTEQSSNAATVTISRSTTGRKTVAMPSISKNGNSLWLAGTDDFLEIADNAVLDIGATDSATVMIVYRQWANFGTNDALIAKKADTTNTTQGYYLGSGASTAARTQGQMGDGTAGVTATETTSRTSGALFTSTMVRDVTADTITVYRNDAAGTAQTDTTTATLANSEAFRIARLSGAGTEYTDAEIYAVLMWKRALSATEVASVANYYKGRIP